ncbi:sulfurtransferase TusA family protein [Halobacillus sp. A5]|uniref:sulfurtransferase TusA family protein n=1 Tax=Halobacillus sp. A5 TaxID=2880263 RepID=UPI0020A63915|nr:sulfurtransferase TusA family protein [Halobacillus sp. A5]MCP3027295.1 sulfurtransferase TusA family protein [Halobacillus sp. A5]
MNIKTNETLDAKGLACPMPIVKTKKTMKNLENGQVLKIEATDKGSTADMKAWAEKTGHQYLGTTEENDVLSHYIRKDGNEDSQEKKHPQVVDNETVQSLDKDSVILDVRESAEYAFDHIPGAKSIPLGELDERISEIDGTKNIYVICRTGSRSDMAAQKLAAKGYEHVYNVVPGMSGWSGETTKSE